MTDEIIKTALKCCTVNKGCIGCPLDKYEGEESCIVKVKKEAFDLINRQNAEIDILIRKKEALRDVIAELEQKIESYAHTIVRCEECEYATKGKNIFICNKEFYKCNGTSCKHNGGHYCSYGKRKESKK